MLWSTELRSLTKAANNGKVTGLAEVAEQADALRSGRSGLYAHVGSTPTFGTTSRHLQPGFFLSGNRTKVSLDFLRDLGYTGGGGTHCDR